MNNTHQQVQAILKEPESMTFAGNVSALKRRIMVMFGGALVAAGMTLGPAPEAQAQSNLERFFRQHQTSSNQYGTSESLRTQRGRVAEVIQVDPVTIRNDNNATFGGMVGAAAGAAAVNRRSSNRNSTTRNLERLVAGGVGAAIGQGIQKRVTQTQGYRITMLEGNGRTVTSVVQEEPLNPGDLVMISGSGRNVRVFPLNQMDQALNNRHQRQQQVAPSQPRRPGW